VYGPVHILPVTFRTVKHFLSNQSPHLEPPRRQPVIAVCAAIFSRRADAILS
jgi:hypothetical protein